MSEQHIDAFLGDDFTTHNYQNTRFPDTGLWLPPEGAYPSLVNWIRALYSIQRLVTVCQGGRIYHDDTDEDNEFSVTSCSVLDRGRLVTVAGSINNALSGGNVAHYIYIDPRDGSLQVETSGWPTTPHVRLGVITLSSGAWTDASLVDHRHTQILNVTGAFAGGRLEHEDVTADDILTADESGKTFTNSGATALVTLTLPTPAAGLEFEFVVLDADGLKIKADSGHTIRIAGNVSDPGGYIQNADIGSTIRLRAVSGTAWVAMGAPAGTWTIDS